MARKFTWVVVPTNPNPCPACDGSGSEWKRRADGAFDRRHRWPIGPCPTCDGSGNGATE